MKKLLAIILAVMMLFSFAACGGAPAKEKVTLLAEPWDGAENEMISVDFFYPEGKGIVVEGDEEYPDTKDFIYEAENCLISASLYEDMTFKENREYDRENEETFSEFKIGSYDCYGYEAFGGYWIYVHLEELSDSTDRFLIITTETIDYDKDFVEGIRQYEDEDIKAIVESFVYNGVVEISEETEESQE